MVVALARFICLGFISKPLIPPRTATTNIAMNREVVDLLSSDSSSSGLPDGIQLDNRPISVDRSVEELSGSDLHHDDENASVSSMDTSLFDRDEFDRPAPEEDSNESNESDSDSDIEILSSVEVNGDDKDGSSSSSSSGLPGPSPLKRTMIDDSPVADIDNNKQSAALALDDPKSNETSEAVPPTKRKITKRRAWGQKKASKSNNKQASEATAPKKSVSAFNHCYLLRSLDPDHPLKTYIGFTTHPSRRIRQHNGILKNGGARRTRRSGRPWTFCCIVGGFESKTAALQFEWAWQNVGKSKAFREAIGDDALARKMGRRRGVKARLEEMRVLLNICKPWSESDGFTVYFMEDDIHVQFCDLLSKAETSVDVRNGELKRRVCSVEDMPFAIDLKSKKKRGKKVAKHTSSSVCNDGETSEIAPSNESAEHSDPTSPAASEDSEDNNEDQSIPSNSSQQEDLSVENLDMQNLSIDQRRYSWEDLSLDSEVEANIASPVRETEQENECTNTANSNPVEVLDLCSP